MESVEDRRRRWRADQQRRRKHLLQLKFDVPMVLAERLTRAAAEIMADDYFAATLAVTVRRALEELAEKLEAEAKERKTKAKKTAKRKR